MKRGTKHDKSDEEVELKRLRDEDPLVRNFAGELYVAAKGFKGGRSFLTSLIEEAGYEVGERTLRTYRTKIEAGGTPLSDSKRSGAKRSLSDAELDLVVGFVVLLHKNRLNEPVSDSLERSLGLSVRLIST